MINPEKRKAIYLLHEEGMSKREISRRLGVSRNTVDIIISQKGNMPISPKKSKNEIDIEILHQLYKDCDGRIQRIHEKLTEEKEIKIAYSTLTRLMRELNISGRKKQRCDRVPDQPGVEMQHDTSPYVIKVGTKKVKIIASVLYFRYSKIRYLKFYRSFNRFKMKCFFHEALTFWGYTAEHCIIDNTNLARLRGTGKNAIIVPEMDQFSKQYGFKFICHEVMHSNRKAGNERSFYTIESNFFPGRNFENMEDLNRQAFDWATIRMANRPVSKTNLIPLHAFEHEKLYLTKLPLHISPPYLEHERGTDQYGYVAFEGNFYWIPGASRYDVKVLEYSNYIKIYHKRELLQEYELPDCEVKNQDFSPDGKPKSNYHPKNRKKPTTGEENDLRKVSKEVSDFIDFIIEQKGYHKHRFIRQLYRMYRNLSPSLFLKTIQRALKYRISDIKTIESIAALQMREENYVAPDAQIDFDYQNRETYMDGIFNDEVDFSIYDKMLEEEEDE